MTKYDMEQDLKQEVQELKISIDTLSKNIGQQFSTLNENLSIGFDQISKQITNLSSTQAVTNTINNTNLVKNHQESLQEPQTTSNIPKDYFIDYSYITDINYSSWVENLKKYSKNMAECRCKKQIPNFCKSARQSLESAIEALFKEEYKYISQNNQTFLKAYDRVKSDRIKNNWTFAEIYVIKNNSEINSEDFKQLDNKYISWKEIEKIPVDSLPDSVEIFFEILKPNFITTRHLQEKFFLIKNMNKLRHLDAHGSSLDINSQLDKLGSFVKVLYNSREKYTSITEVVSWFIREVYKRIEILKNL